MPALSAKNVLNVEKMHLRAFLACRPGLELFARPHNDPVIRISSDYTFLFPLRQPIFLYSAFISR